MTVGSGEAWATVTSVFIDAVNACSMVAAVYWFAVIDICNQMNVTRNNRSANEDLIFVAVIDHFYRCSLRYLLACVAAAIKVVNINRWEKKCFNCPIIMLVFAILSEKNENPYKMI